MREKLIYSFMVVLLTACNTTLIEEIKKSADESREDMEQVIKGFDNSIRLFLPKSWSVLSSTDSTLIVHVNSDTINKNYNSISIKKINSHEIITDSTVFSLLNNGDFGIGPYNMIEKGTYEIHDSTIINYFIANDNSWLKKGLDNSIIFYKKPSKTTHGHSYLIQSNVYGNNIRRQQGIAYNIIKSMKIITNKYFTVKHYSQLSDTINSTINSTDLLSSFEDLSFGDTIDCSSKTIEKLFDTKIRKFKVRDKNNNYYMSLQGRPYGKVNLIDGKFGLITAIKSRGGIKLKMKVFDKYFNEISLYSLSTFIELKRTISKTSSIYINQNNFIIFGSHIYKSSDGKWIQEDERKKLIINQNGEMSIVVENTVTKDVKF